MYSDQNSFRSFGCALLLCAALCTPALAQDMTDWEGAYAGLGVGASMGEADPDTRVLNNGYFVDPLPASDSAQLNPILQRVLEGWDAAGSAIAGYNFQHGHFVYGLEADLTVADFEQSTSAGPIAYDTAPAATFLTRTTVESSYTASLRPRIGYAADGFLLALSAGPSISTFKTTLEFSDTFGGGSSLRFKDTQTRLGFSASAGAAYQVADGWSVRGDYVFSQFSDIANGRPNFAGSPAADFDIDVDFQSHNLRLAVLKRF